MGNELGTLRAAARESVERDSADAVDLLARLVEADPDDEEAVVDLAYLLWSRGRRDEAAEVLARAPETPAVLRAAVDLLGSVEAAQALARAVPDDVLALLDAAELAMGAGDHDEAARLFRRLRRVDADHQREALLGVVAALGAARRWREAFHVALDVTRVDRHQLTTDVLARLTAEVFGRHDTLAPSWDELDAHLAARRREHRRVHAEALLP